MSGIVCGGTTGEGCGMPLSSIDAPCPNCLPAFYGAGGGTEPRKAMPPTTEPRTEAGRALDEWSKSDARPLDEFVDFRTFGEVVAAIEAEATRTALEDIAERVRGLHEPLAATDVQRPKTRGWNAALDAVLALFSDRETT